MTTLDIVYYLMLGVILGVYSSLQGWLGQGAGRGSHKPHEDGLEAALRTICRLERTDDLEQLLKRLTQRYEIIVAACAEGAIDDCAQPMDIAFREELSAALATRRQCGEAHDARLITACSAHIVAAAVTDSIASLDLAFTALVQHRPAGQVAGETCVQPVEAMDIWTFDRSTDPRRPEWLLVATEPVQ